MIFSNQFVSYDPAIFQLIRAILYDGIGGECSVWELNRNKTNSPPITSVHILVVILARVRATAIPRPVPKGFYSNLTTALTSKDGLELSTTFWAIDPVGYDSNKKELRPGNKRYGDIVIANEPHKTKMTRRIYV